MSETLRRRVEAFQTNPARQPLTCYGAGGPCSDVRLVYARDDECGLTLRCPTCGHEQFLASHSLFYDTLERLPAPGDVDLASVLTPAHTRALRQVIGVARAHYEARGVGTIPPEVKLAREIARSIERAVSGAS